MTTATATDTYFRNQVESATPLQRVVMLYDGAISLLEESARSMRARDYESAPLLNIRAQNVIMELQGSLNMKAGGELSSKLHALYAYFLRQLIAANSKRDPEMLSGVSAHLREIRESWAELASGEAKDEVN
jgi:flagellar secretion chaperone FliS